MTLAAFYREISGSERCGVDKGSDADGVLVSLEIRNQERY